MSVDEFRRLEADQKGKGKHKYRNQPVRQDGLLFASRKELERWNLLRAMYQAGHISNLQRQVPYKLVVNGVLICKYLADFVYIDLMRKRAVVEDAKGFRTKEYKLKKKLMLAVWGIQIEEV